MTAKKIWSEADLASWQCLLEEGLGGRHLHSTKDTIQRDACGMKKPETATDENSLAIMNGTRIVLFVMTNPNAEAFNPHECAYPIGPVLTEAEAEMTGPVGSPQHGSWS